MSKNALVRWIESVIKSLNESKETKGVNRASKKISWLNYTLK
jgi:hypothetical protein